MSVSAGPYKGILPFLNIESFAVAETAVGLILSNEIAMTSTTPAKTITFGNFIFLSSNKEIIEGLNVDDAALKDKILSGTATGQNNVYYFTLDTKTDFRYKINIQRDHGIDVVQHKHTQVYHMDLSPSSTQDLYVLVASFANNGNNNITLGNVLKETILIAGRPPLESYLYKMTTTQDHYGEKDSIWPGAVHRILQSSMAGRYHTGEPHPILSADKVINVKSRDTRIIHVAAQATPQIMDRVDISNLNLPAVTLGGLAAGLLAGSMGHFSPLHTSRDRDGVVYGYFAFDIHDYFKDNSLFGKYIQNSAALAACVELLDIQIFRSATKKLDIRSNKLTAGGTQTGLCKLKTPGAHETIIQVASLNSGVEVIKRFNDGEIIGIAFRDDNAVQYATTGFQYHVRVLLSDKTKEVFMLIAEQIGQLVRECGPDDAPISACQNLVNFYMASIEFLNGIDGFGPFTRREWQKNLLTAVSSFSGEHDLAAQAYGLYGEKEYIVNSLIRAYGLAIRSILQSNREGTKSAVADFHSSIYRSKNFRPLMAIADLNGGIELGTSSGTGLNYIDDYLSNTGAVIPSITYQRMQQRVLAEETKYPEATENAQTTNSFGYLTPTSVALGNNPPIDTTSQNIDLGDDQALFANQGAPGPWDMGHSSYENSNAAVINSVGISITALPVSLNRLVAASELVEPQTTPSSQILGENASAFNTDNSTEQTANSGSDESIINVHLTQEGAFSGYGSALAAQLLGDEFNNWSQATPPPVGLNYMDKGSLAANTPAANQIPTEPILGVLNFGSQVRVEYLSSYGVQSGIGAENWSILTDVIFSDARTNSELLICRLVKIEEVRYGTFSNPIFTPLTTLFIIGPLGRIRIEGKYGPLLSSYIEQNSIYLTEFQGFANAYRNEVFYSQTVPMHVESLNAAAEFTSTPSAPEIPPGAPSFTPSIPSFDYAAEFEERRQAEGERRRLEREASGKSTGYK